MSGGAARRLLSRGLAGLVRGAVRSGGRAVRLALTYHDVGDSPGAVPAAVLAAQIERARAAGFHLVPLGAMVDWLAGRRRLPGRALCLTFDDGLASTARSAGPVLERLQAPAAVFPVLSFLDGPRRYGSERARAILAADDGDPRTRPWDYMTWDELDAWVAAGREVGGHTLTHPWLGEVDESRGRREIADCRQQLAERYGAPPRVFCYPFGDAGGAAPRWVAAAGFEAAVTTAPGLLGRRSDPWLLPRVPAPAEAGAAFDDILFGLFQVRASARRLLSRSVR